MRTNIFDSVVENNVLDFLAHNEMFENLHNCSFEKNNWGNPFTCTRKHE